MTADPVLTLAWLALAHLVADFVIQTERVATDKFGHGWPSWRSLGFHTAGVAVCLIPVAVAYGTAGVAFLVSVSAAHAVIDRTKVVWTRRVEARAMRRAHREHEGEPREPSTSLGSAWTPIPGFLFVLDQLAHAAAIAAAWALLLDNAPLTSVFVDAVRGLPQSWDAGVLHRVVLTGVVVVDLLIVNVRAGMLFVATLVHPRAAVTGHYAELDGPARAHAGIHLAAHAQQEPARPSPTSQPPTAYTLRIGPIVATAEPAHPEPREDAARRSAAEAPTRAVAPPAQVGAAIGVLERLIIVTLVMTGGTAAIGLVIAAKTLARFKQLDDRDFAEYYLLGTLASVAVALVSGLLAAAVLATA